MARLEDGEFQHNRRFLIESDIAQGIRWSGMDATETSFDLRTHFFEVEMKLALEYFSGFTVAFTKQSEKQMLRPDISVVESDSLFAAEREYF